jgi:hypothetical protein
VSYSFTVKGKTRKIVVDAVGDQLDFVTQGQPVHNADVGTAESAISELVGVLVEPGEGEVYEVSVAGSVSWRAENEYTAASLNVSARITKE